MAVMAVEAVGGAATSAEAGAAAASRSAASKRASSRQGAAARRQVVLGQVTESRHDRPGRASQTGGGAEPPVSRATRDQRNTSSQQRKSRGRNTTGRAHKKIVGKQGGGVLLTEYLAAVAIIVYATIVKGPKQGYQVVMSELVIRLTALTMIFFVLFLMAGTKLGKAAGWFGLLVDLGVLFTATQDGAIKQLASVVQGQPLKDETGKPLDTALLESETEPTSAVSVPPDVGGQS